MECQNANYKPFFEWNRETQRGNDIMLTTVTTTTTTTTTTTVATTTTTVATAATTATTATTATAVGAQAAVYGAIGVCILIMLLIAKELLSAYGEESEGKGEIRGRDISAKSLAMNLNAAICPLLFSFALIVVVKVLEVL